MNLATQDDVQDRLRRDLTTDELEFVDALLEEASVLVEAWLKKRGITYSEVGDVPRLVSIVVSRMVARSLTTPELPGVPDGANDLGAGPFRAGFSDPYTRNIYLSKADERWLCNLFDSATSVSLVSERGGWGS